MPGPGRKASIEVPAEMPEPLDRQSKPPLDQYCDLVLKGGVIDGVIYPGVLFELARHYRFQSIAGTSVGAIAASLAAASEYSRRFGSDDGFNEVLRKIPDELAKIPDPKTGETKLQTLFQPDKPLKKLFHVFVEVASVPVAGFKGKFVRTIWDAYKTDFYKHFVLCFIVLGLIAIGFSASLWSWHIAVEFSRADWRAVSTVSALVGVMGIIIAGLAGIGGIAWSIWREYKVLASSEGWGFCSGISTDGGKTEGLIEWLHKGIQGAAKLPLSRPLTFQDLWDAPGGPKLDNGQPVPKSIDLRMISTSLSHGRPYELPVTDPSIRLFFKVSELEDYFPESILQHLKDKALPYAKREKYYAIDPSKNDDWLCDPYPEDVDPRDFRELPVGDLPVLVAVRLSMNFPILFKAVALWAVDVEAGLTPSPRQVWAPKFKRAWFTDGGVTSNFPVHIFDSPIPNWPTFGVYIDERSRSNRNAFERDKPARWWLPTFHTSGRAEKWMPIKDDRAFMERVTDANSGFATYLKAIAVTAKDWADHANMRMPGVRDRVVTVYKNGETNGGLNLKLESQKILNLGYRNGVEAGQALARKFLTDTKTFNKNLQGTPGWLDHRWVRFNSYIAALKEHITGFSTAINNARGTPPIAEQIDQAMQKAPLKFEKYIEHTLTDVQADALKKTVLAIQALEAALASDPVAQPYTAKPQPELRSRSRI